MNSPIPVLKGDNIILRRANASDIEARFVLGNDPDIFEMFGVSRGQVRAITREDATRWVQSLAQHPHAWVIESRASFCGEIRLDRVDLHDRRASMAVGIFDPEFLGRGIGSEAINLVIEYAFGVMQLHRIGIRVLAYNKRAIRAYEKCGFVAEGRERESAFVNGAWRDDIMMGLLDHEFSWRKAES